MIRSRGHTVSIVGYILVGVLGFVAGYFFELASLKRVAIAKPLLGIAAASLLAYSTVMVSLDSERFWLPGWLQVAGWLLLPVSTFLLVYSLLLELPFLSTYRVQDRGPHLVTRGTYALVRHPTVPWYVLLLLSLLLVSRAELLLLAFPIWVSLDVAWIVLQERLLLDRVFPEYGAYRRSTPMLIPNRRSVVACLKSLRAEGERAVQGRW